MSGSGHYADQALRRLSDRLWEWAAQPRDRHGQRCGSVNKSPEDSCPEGGQEQLSDADQNVVSPHIHAWCYEAASPGGSSSIRSGATRRSGRSSADISANAVLSDGSRWPLSSREIVA
jgi:hypothetical protein